MYFCYILYSKTKHKTYTGFTSNLKKRLETHREEPTRTNKQAKDYKLIWYSAFTNKGMALSFEKYLKTRSGRVFMRKRLIGSLNK